MPSRLEQYQKRRQDLDSKIKAIEEKQTAKQSKAEERRKFLVGESILCLIERGEVSQDWLNKILDQQISRKNDRALFGLPVNETEA